MNYRLLSTDDTTEWRNLLKRLPSGDIYFLPEYHRLYEIDKRNTACAFIVEENDSFFFYPFFIRPIHTVGSTRLSDPCCDIETVVGYTGPLATTDDRMFLQRAWASFSGWCRETHVIAEFIRFNPFLENYRFTDGSYQIVEDRDLVLVALDCPVERLWSNYPSVQRNMIRKAERKGFVCEETSLDRGMDVFVRLYEATMVRVASSSYPQSYFDLLKRVLDNSAKFFTVKFNNIVVSMGLFLVYGDRIHYHLVGNNPHYEEFAPNNFLLHTVAVWGAKNGFRWLHLGGGRTAAPDDSLLRFKTSISRTRVPYRLGKRIHNRPLYEKLCSMWMQQKGLSELPSYFFPYRMM
jgi:Acetyltransferase (GNAT) domain